MKRWRWPLIALVLVVGACAGWWFGSPWWTLHQMKQAADARDVDALSAYIDFPALRADVKAQLGDRLRPDDRTADFGDLLLGKMGGVVADAVIRPETLGAVFAATAAVDPPMGMRAEEMTYHRDGLSQFRLVKTTGKGGELVFRRYGLGWKLSGVKIPPKALRFSL